MEETLDNKCSYQSQLLDVRVLEFRANKSKVEIINDMFNMSSVNLDQIIPIVNWMQLNIEGNILDS
jgi:hypothetical protein